MKFLRQISQLFFKRQKKIKSIFSSYSMFGYFNQFFFCYRMEFLIEGNTETISYGPINNFKGNIEGETWQQIDSLMHKNLQTSKKQGDGLKAFLHISPKKNKQQQKKGVRSKEKRGNSFSVYHQIHKTEVQKHEQKYHRKSLKAKRQSESQERTKKYIRGVQLQKIKCSLTKEEQKIRSFKKLREKSNKNENIMMNIRQQWIDIQKNKVKRTLTLSEYISFKNRSIRNSLELKMTRDKENIKIISKEKLLSHGIHNKKIEEQKKRPSFKNKIGSNSQNFGLSTKGLKPQLRKIYS